MIKRLLSATVLFAALPLFAQGPGGPGPADHGFEGRGPGLARAAVTNAPYSATFTSTSTEKLQDGTVLTRISTRTVARDSLGRTREEITMPARSGSTDGKTHTMVVILDPVAHTVTRLRPEEKVAVVHALPQPGQGRFEGRHGDHGGPPAPPDAANKDAAAKDGRPHGPREEKNVAKTDLGSKTIAGVVATGTRVTRTIPAGEIGNAAPIVSTHEEWFSPDLKIELSRSDVDPFHGTRTTATSALTKTEPDATLFKVPDGYTVQQAPERAFGHGHGAQHGGTAVPSAGA